MISKISQHFGFIQMPFGRDLSPAELHRHAEAAAAIHGHLRQCSTA